MDTKDKYEKNYLILGDLSGQEARKILNEIVDDLLNISYEDLTSVEKSIIRKTCKEKI